MFTATKPCQEDGWISPDGQFYPCGYARHSEFADFINMTVYQMEQAGWVHISDSTIVNYKTELTLTQPQRDTLFDMMMLDPGSSLGIDIHFWISLQG